MIHELKIHPEYFQSIVEGKKTFEARSNDRNYQIGDTLILKEWNPESHIYTGKSLTVEVTFILDDLRYCAKDIVIMSIAMKNITVQAEKTRKLLDSLDCISCGRAVEISTKGICAPTCGSEYRLDDEIQRELSELEDKATKWDMIQWAIKEEIDFVLIGDGTGSLVWLTGIDIERLEKLYKERENNGL